MKAEAAVSEGTIVVRTTLEGMDFETVKNMCKEPRGARWSKTLRAWKYPLSVDACHELREAFGNTLVIHETLAAWYKANRAAADAQAVLANATDATLTRLPSLAPTLAATLRPDQRVGVQWVANPYRNAGLVADEPGLGKTLEMIGGILEADLQGPILVTCPRVSVKTVWHNEIRKWAPDERVYVCRGTRPHRQRAITRFLEDPAPRKWLIVVSETLRVKEELHCKIEGCELNPRQRGPRPHDNDQHGRAKPTIVGYEYEDLFSTEWAATIVDESHKAFGSLTVVKGTLFGKGLKRLNTERRYAVTGTPFGKGGRLQGMFGTLHWLWPDEYTSFWRWAEKHFYIEDEYIGRGKTAKKIGDLRGGKNEEQFLREFGPRILRRTKAEVLPWLPAKQYRVVECEMGPAQRKQYDQILDDAEVITDGGVIGVDGVLAAITRSKQVANGCLRKGADGKVTFSGESCKADVFMELMEERGILDGSGDMKVLVTSQFNEFLYLLRDQLKVPSLLLVGETSDAKREALIEQFQQPGGPRVFFLNAKAGGVSVTLDAADEVHMMDELWDPGDNVQVEDRVHRASRAGRSAEEAAALNRRVATILQYRTVGTIDSNIGDDVEERRRNQHAVLDGRRGMDYIREVAKYRPDKEED